MDLLIGVGVVIWRDGKVLLGKRKGSHGAASWGLPGGHLEAGESIAACARRETREETGLQLNQLSKMGYTSDIFSAENKHYITLFVEARDVSGTERVREPEKCECWQWYCPDELPDELFLPLKSFVQQGGLG